MKQTPLRLLITAGPTREPIDDVRFISNRSSGRVGLALAEAGMAAGHDVTLLLGPVLVSSKLHERCRVERFTTAGELFELLETHLPACDVLIMAAAVADYRATARQPGKQRFDRSDEGQGHGRGEGEVGSKGELTLRLEPTPDLVGLMARRKQPHQKIIAFALEEDACLEERARQKMRRKGVDAIVANPLSTMDAGDIAPILLTAAGRREAPGPMVKTDFARWLIEQVGAGV